jgi:predicted RNA-binding Zn-ribbon protein involved in translation (DUF1610 family)
VTERALAGRDTRTGVCQCTTCGFELTVDGTEVLPPCPNCGNGAWEVVAAQPPP